jgi:hypothetical protein
MTGPSQSFCSRDGGPVISVADPPSSNFEASTSHSTLVPPAQQPRPATLRTSGTGLGSDLLSSSGGLKPPYRADPRSVFDGDAMGNDRLLFTRSPISRLLRPILNFMMCPEVSQFLKQAEAQPGLRGTPIFDLFWVLDNLFNVHGGVRSLAPSWT